MSTRCQVYVHASGLPWNAEAVTLYHHSDGYPSHMLSCIGEAFKLATTPVPYPQTWQAGRPGKAASFLCASHPGIFEPESGHELHGDIEYFYDVECINTENGSTAEKGSWRVKVYRVPYSEKSPTRETMRASVRRTFKVTP